MITLINQCLALYNLDCIFIYAAAGRAIRVTAN